MKIHFSSLGIFIPADFNMTSEHANEFIPLVCGQNMSVKDGIQYYSKPSFEKHLKRPNTLKNIKEGFELGGTTRRIEINGRVFFIAKGVFFSEAGVPLMVCAMKKEAFLDPLVSKFSDHYLGENFSYTNYVLFYSTSFFTDPGLTPLNRRLQKEILQSCYEKGIEVRILSSLEIEKNTFARLFEVKKTKSLTQLEAYMEQVLPNFLHNNGEDNFIEQEFAPVTIHREELSVEEEALLFDNEMRDLIVDSIQREVENTIHFDSSLSLSVGSNLTTSTGIGPNTIGYFPSSAISNTYTTTTTGLTMPPRQMTELEELAAEAAQFDPPSEDSEEDYTDEEYNEDWENDEQDEDEEELRRHEESAHTVSEVLLPRSHPTDSLVERMRPLAQQYNAAIFQNSSGVPINTGPEWQSIIQLIDDTE